MNPQNGRDILILLLFVKILAAASIASVLARFVRFKKMLFLSDATLRDRAIFGIWLGVPLLCATALRVALTTEAPDLSLEGAILAGVLGGPVAGIIAGGFAALPALLHKELLALPVMISAGLLGAFARHLASVKDDIWHFSPFFDFNVYRWFRQRFGYPRGDWQMFFFLLIIVVEAGRVLLGRAFPGRLYYLFDSYPPVVIAIFLTSIACTAIPLTIWKNVRNEITLEEQRTLLMQARLDALSAQINPHFLFNTLNSIASLVRTDPETARHVIFKLSSILRQLLKKHENFTSLRDELSFVDDYLSIEVIRFGPDKLKIVKEIDDPTLSLMVPSMLLQPIVENAIRHGLSPKLEGGMIHIRSARDNGRLLLEVRDNGVGISQRKLEERSGAGIGWRNVQERLRVLYGSEFTFLVESADGGGTSIRIGIPLLAN